MTSKKPKISVIIPIYNVEKFLRECIDSVVEQTYTDLEIILVDDGSPDNCGAICEEYAKTDARIKVIHKENGGLSDARNEGIAIATGDYITFVDSDDFLSRDAIEYMWALISENLADVSVCQKFLIDEEGKALKDKRKYKNAVYFGNEKCMKAYMSSANIGSVAWAKLYKREIFSRLRFPKGKYNEDEFTTYRAVALSNRIAVGKEQKYAYRKRGDSIMNSSFSLKHTDCVEASRGRADFIKEKYPRLYRYARAHVVHAMNLTVNRIARAKSSEVDTRKLLEEYQKEYRKHFHTMAFTKFSLFSKLFALLSAINVKWVIKLLKK